MSITCLNPEKNDELKNLIAICKSNSDINGFKLREAHYKLGQLLAKRIALDFHNFDITLIIMMRAGLCFGMGIADTLEQSGIKPVILFHFNEQQWEREKANCSKAFNNDILLAEAVINTGKNILQFAEKLPNNRPVFFASNVLSEKAIKNFENKQVYTVRVSEKSFIGAKTSIVKNGKGPDTGDRLFSTW